MEYQLHRDLIYAAYLGGDGTMKLSRNNKGGGEATDPSLFGDDAFYAPNAEYKEFSRARGGAPDDHSVSFGIWSVVLENLTPN